MIDTYEIAKRAHKVFEAEGWRYGLPGEVPTVFEISSTIEHLIDGVLTDDNLGNHDFYETGRIRVVKDEDEPFGVGVFLNLQD